MLTVRVDRVRRDYRRCGRERRRRAHGEHTAMFRTRYFFGLVVLSACISRGGGPGDTPQPDAAVDMTMVSDTGVSDGGTTDGPPRDRPMCSTTMSREDSMRECMDGLDNDCNGFADCDDFNCRTCANPQCLMNNMVTLPRDAGTCTCMGTEDTTAACSDGLDNDCDGFTDCQDFSCQSCSVSVCLSDGGLQRADAGFCLCRGQENTNAACMDGLDNDCNGFIDCNDFSCSRPDGGAITVCDSGTRTDAAVDARSCDSSGAENTTASCSDGIDNDCDGFTDCDDFSCRTCNVTSCVRDGGVTTRDGGVCTCRGGENTNANCMDGIDNDCDGFIDCRDFDCTMSDGGVTVCPTDAGASDGGSAG